MPEERDTAEGGDGHDGRNELDEIRSIANPIARRYNIAALYLFGSYARGEATAQSDLDFRVDRGKMTDFLEQIKPEEVLIYAS